MHGGCREGVQRVHGVCAESAWRVHGGLWWGHVANRKHSRMSRGCMEGVWRVHRGCARGCGGDM